MYKLGITGGIGSGKSTAAKIFDDLGAVVFNADKEAKKHLKHTLSLQHKIIDAFGDDVTENNKLNIKKLAKVAFADKIAQDILNGLVWPEIFVLVDNALKEASSAKSKLFVLDAAMIFEANIEHMFDSSLLILSKKQNRLDRALKRKNLPLEQIQNRMSLQMSEKEKKIKATYVIENNYSIELFHEKIIKFYNTLPI